MKKHGFTRFLSIPLAFCIAALLLPFSAFSVTGEDEVQLDPLEFGEKSAFLSHLPQYESTGASVTWQGGWQVGTFRTAASTFTPFTVMNDDGILSTNGTVWGAGGGLYITNNQGQIALSACMPEDGLVNEIRYTAQHSGRAVLSYDQLDCKCEGATTADYIAFSFSVYLNGERLWPTDGEWFTYQSDATYTSNATLSALTAVQQNGLPLTVALDEGDVVSFRTRQANANTQMLHANPTVTYTLIEHTHTYGTPAPYNATQHVSTCSCGKQRFTNHTFDGGSVTTPPTVTAEGVTTYTCTLCGATTTSSIARLAPRAGDVDGDGKVTNADVLCLFRYLHDQTQYPLSVAEMADVDGDGSITNADALYLFRYLHDPVRYPLLFPRVTEEPNELPVHSLLGL